ncbi:hypothetical protein TGAMA5MH_00964 [Trichoderma gamsii]|uniref:Phenol 2-monooxygenase n=1 Tax=Trichoderma gamsii TaxID=398673 RepID=A0A2K0TQV7_9HYPO|nr:hypothetical protein TGAMA5MH_00964 [Trichoderma gamsii]
MTDSYTDVLIIGAGPAGLMASLYLSELGVNHRIIDKLGTRALNGRADGFQVRTVEIWDSFNMANLLENHGNHFREWVLWTGEKEISRQRVETSIGEEVSHKNTGTFHQGFIEASLISGIRKRGGTVERGIKATSMSISEADHPTAITVKHLHATEMDQWHVGAHFKHDDGTLEPQKGTIDAFGDDPQDIVPSTNQQGTQETIHAKYVIGADGGRSWLRNELGFRMNGANTNSVWGVIDIIALTDFPDIRKICTILSSHGTVLIVPREHGFTRLYVQLPDEDPATESSSNSTTMLEKMLATAQQIFAPYSMDYKICDWWTVYKVGHRIADHFSYDNRIFLAGDAVHTHTPKGGQGMNVSQQDAYNLAWKIAGVLRGQLKPEVLSTYESERQPIAKELVDLDGALSDVLTSRSQVPESHVKDVYDRLRYFGSGTNAKYGPSPIVAEHVDKVATNIICGARLPNAYIYNLASGRRLASQSLLKSDGSWYLFVLAGDIASSQQLARVNGLGTYLATLSHKFPHLSSRKMTQAFIRILLCAVSSDFKAHDLNSVYFPMDTVRGHDYNTVFGDQPDKGAYGRKLEHSIEAEGTHKLYGVDQQVGAMLLIRPDQTVAWKGSLDNVSGLEEMLLNFMRVD